MNATIGDRLERGRRRRFVGRTAELATVREALRAPAESFGVLFVHGPGVVGKSALLGELVEAAEQARRRPIVVDGEEVEPSPSGFTEAIGAALSLSTGSDVTAAFTDSSVLFVDTFEWLSPIEGWFRRRFLPRLPVGALVVVAGRRPPTSAWLADAGWRDLLRVVGLRNLSPVDVRAYANIEGLSGELGDQVVELTHGHPLAVSLLFDALRRSGDPTRIPPSWGEAPDLVRALLGHIVDDVPSVRELAALHVCARARTTTEATLRSVLPGDDAPALFNWLQTQTFVGVAGDGVRPHDIAREVLDADLRWRDPEMHADIYRRVRQHEVDQIRHRATDTPNASGPSPTRCSSFDTTRSPAAATGIWPSSAEVSSRRSPQATRPSCST